MNGNVCLVVIFNHPFIDAIKVWEQEYRNRFSTIKYLVPFYQGNNDDIITVYESSYQFQGYMIQSFDKIFDEKYEWYFFVADDMLLNPRLNENNIINELHLKNKDFYIHGFSPINLENGYHWGHSHFYMRAFLNKAVNYQEFIPTYEEALLKIKTKFPNYKEYFEDDYFKNATTIEKEEFLKRNRGNKVVYPVLKAYSDIFVCHKSIFRKFAELCGVFSAMNLFVEMAIPTAMALLSDKIMFETEFKIKTFWEEDRKNFEEKYELKISELLKDYQEDVLAYHPVKMSKWILDV